MSYRINTCVWLVFLDCLNSFTMMKPATKNAVADVWGLYVHLPTSNRWKEWYAVRTACHIVIKALLVKFVLAAHTYWTSCLKSHASFRTICDAVNLRTTSSKLNKNAERSHFQSYSALWIFNIRGTVAPPSAAGRNYHNVAAANQRNNRDDRHCNDLKKKGLWH